MKKKCIANKRGIALLITITVIMLFMTVAVELNRKMRSVVLSTAAMRDRLMLKHMASSGIHAGMAMLISDKHQTESDSLQDNWADPEAIEAVLNDMPFSGGKLTLKISDELGKIQINALVKFPEGRLFNNFQKMLWYQFLTPLKSRAEIFKEMEPISIINSIKDWLDSGDNEAITGLGGAESAYYGSFDPPYRSRNGPLPHLGELVLIKGVPHELFHGLGETSEISKYMTVYGATRSKGNKLTYEGRININTAALPILAALLPLDQQELAQSIYDYRAEISKLKNTDALADPAWYKNAPGFSGIKIEPKLLTTRSDIFSIESTASLNEMKMTTFAVVERRKEKKSGKWICKILNWQTK